MVNETPDGTFEYGEYRDKPWFENGMVDPETGETQEWDGIVDWLDQVEVRAPIVVESWSDLPANDPDRVDKRTGQARQRYVLEHDLLVYDDGQEWRALGGLGSADRPLPPMHVQEGSQNSHVSRRDHDHSGDSLGEDEPLGSVHTERLEEGVAGDGNTIEGIAGTTGQIITVWAAPYGPGGYYTADSTSFEPIAPFEYQHRQAGAIAQTPLQNTELVVRVVGRTWGSPDEDITIRLNDTPETEVTGTEGGVVIDSEWETVGSLPRDLEIEGRVSSGTADITVMTIFIGRRIL